MATYDSYRLLFSVAVSGLVCYRASTRQSLNPSGCIAAFFIGTITMYSGWRFAITMLAFFFSSSKLSNRSDGTPPRRNWKQVLCNALVGTLCAVHYHYTMQTFDAYPFLASPSLSTFALGGFISFYACATGDTWASEIGVLSSAPTRLITAPWRVVPKGTNGGVTLLGVGASIAGGLFIGITFWFSMSTSLEQLQNYYGETKRLNFDGLIESETPQYWAIAIATWAGLFGSLLDSVLGATLQFSGVSDKHRGIVFEDPNKVKFIKRVSGRHILTNNDVNWITTLITCFVGGCISVWVFC
eukprot:44106_1